MVSIHSGTINSNFQIFNPYSLTKNSNKFKILYNNNEFLLQTPKAKIISVTQPFENLYKITLKFDNYNFDSKTKEFIDQIKSIDKMIRLSEKQYWKKLNKNSRNKMWINCLYINDIKTSYYFNLTIDLNILSIFDHNKNIRDINYLIKHSECISIIYLKSIWQSKNKIGLEWLLFQTKIFHPIQKLTECIIYDEHENNPLLHYFNSNTDSKIETKSIVKNKKENHPVYGKFVKLKRLGANENAIKIKLEQDGLNISDFNNFMYGHTTEVSKLPLPIPKPVFSANLFKNAKLKKVTTSRKKIIPKSENSIKQCIITQDTLMNAIANLRKNNTSLNKN